jgi:high-affinity nickel permease
MAGYSSIISTIYRMLRADILFGATSPLKDFTDMRVMRAAYAMPFSKIPLLVSRKRNT